MQQGTSETETRPAGNLGYQFSVVELLVAVTALGCILGGLTFFGWFGASSIAVTVGVLLLLRGRYDKRRWITRVGAGVSALSFFLLCVLLLEWLCFGVGPIYSAAKFPYQFNRMAEIADADTTDAKVYGLGSFIDSEHLWRLTLTPDQLDRVVAKYGLVDVPESEITPQFWRLFPNSWKLAKRERSRYFSTLNFPTLARGNDGDHYMAVYDPKNQWLYVWCKFNF